MTILLVNHHTVLLDSLFKDFDVAFVAATISFSFHNRMWVVSSSFNHLSTDATEMWVRFCHCLSPLRIGWWSKGHQPLFD